MSTSEKVPADGTVPAPPVDTAALAAMTDRVFAANREFAQAASGITREMMAFATRRLRAQMEFVSALPRIGDLNGLMEAQLRYVEEASRDYSRELGEVSQMLLKAQSAMNGAAPAKPPN